ncbi:glycosyltransferase family 39 protein [Gaetbulibacter sp. M240]|uniref:ArnT family glycosyltransferase n=1 Tax=Gaetbulibacter sp. M240 TaxID=3126511 RepID=UPI00374E2E92
MKKIDDKLFFVVAIIFLLVIRLFLNAYIPLMDKTEARYGEIARIMAETGNWITPQIDYNTPFWAKPPLSTWLSALSMKLFGVNEFALRFPAFLLSIGIIAVLKNYVKDHKHFFIVAFILLTIPEFLLHAGVVSTDTALAFCVSMIFLSFWKFINNDSGQFWKYLIFVFVGIGILAKGPIVIILTAPPIFIWALYYGKLLQALKKMPWIIGMVLVLIIAGPWFLLAEEKTPGFLDYFFVGEHYKRFFDSSWKGDKYGFPKQQPLGIIWAFLLAFAFPWVEILIAKLWNRKRQVLKDSWTVYLLLWLLWTPFFFTFSKSLIHTYILPVMVPIALLLQHYWESFKNKKTILGLSLVLPIAIIGATVFSLVGNNLENLSKTDKYILKHRDPAITDLYYLDGKSYSSQFYSAGKIKEISEKEVLIQIEKERPFEIIIEKKYLKDRDKVFINKLRRLAENRNNILYVYQPN